MQASIGEGTRPDSFIQRGSFHSIRILWSFFSGRYIQYCLESLNKPYRNSAVTNRSNHAVHASQGAKSKYDKQRSAKLSSGTSGTCIRRFFNYSIIMRCTLQ